MHIGIMSDSHGDIPRTIRAIEAIRKYEPVHVFHCGDICSQQVITELEAGFAEPEVPVTCVLGNCDSWSAGLSPDMSFLRIEPHLAKVEIAGRKIAVVHGHEMDLFEQVCMSGEFAYVLTGHTHVRSDDQFNDTRVINPGALHRSPEPSCAVLNIMTDELKYLFLS